MAHPVVHTGQWLGALPADPQTRNNSREENMSIPTDRRNRCRSEVRIDKSFIYLPIFT